jgi:Raf kinase inhibitor-like YbhB/YbcL family protein
MPAPGSHKYDVKRTRLRAEYDDHGVPDQHADEAANAELHREHPPRRVGDPDRAAGPKGERPPAGPPPGREPAHIALRSSAFADHGLMPDRFAYERDNVSPPLEWDGVPEGTTELTLVCEDPDAPNGPFVHWVVTHIAPDSGGTAENATPPSGSASRNGFGEPGWGGPRPPVGDPPHRYVFHLYALDHTPTIREDLPPQDLHRTLSAEAKATGTLVGLFAR